MSPCFLWSYPPTGQPGLLHVAGLGPLRPATSPGSALQVPLHQVWCRTQSVLFSKKNSFHKTMVTEGYFIEDFIGKTGKSEGSIYFTKLSSSLQKSPELPFCPKISPLVILHLGSSIAFLYPQSSKCPFSYWGNFTLSRPGSSTLST